MKKLNWLQKFVMWAFHIPVPFDIELALRVQLHRGIGIGLKQNKIYTLEPLPSVWIDESERKHVQIQMSTAPTRPFFESGMSTYEPPERTTDPFAEIHQHLQERRVLMRHNTRSLARKIQLIGDDPDATQYEVPAFLKDQAM